MLKNAIGHTVVKAKHTVPADDCERIDTGRPLLATEHTYVDDFNLPKRRGLKH
ncbi:hypothetical protein WN51_09758 [Melipona quadrifasciata]|uniref:Uncharacterized protein n=1 Tax=Melipona quadrifasciata TaxID=166423 RepID=A0A0N0BIA7_9HYME|nr:hypothetical protein WN51_09758 [Melipona quadrifasciata]